MTEEEYNARDSKDQVLIAAMSALLLVLELADDLYHDDEDLVDDIMQVVEAIEFETGVSWQMHWGSNASLN